MDADIELATLTSLLDLDEFEGVEATRDRRNKLQQFCCVLIDHTNGRVLDVLESREKQVVIRWMKTAKESGLLSKLEEHCEALRLIFEDKGLTDPQVTVTRLKRGCEQGARMGLKALEQFNSSGCRFYHTP